MTLTLTSSGFKHQGSIPQRYTCDGENVSPPLAWEGIPPGTKSLALIVDDPDTPDRLAPRSVGRQYIAEKLRLVIRSEVRYVDPRDSIQTSDHPHPSHANLWITDLFFGRDDVSHHFSLRVYPNKRPARRVPYPYCSFPVGNSS